MKKDLENDVRAFNGLGYLKMLTENGPRARLTWAILRRAAEERPPRRVREPRVAEHRDEPVAGRQVRGIATARELASKDVWEIDTLVDACPDGGEVIAGLLRQAAH